MAELTERQMIGQVASVTLMTEWIDKEFLDRYIEILQREINKFKRSLGKSHRDLVGFIDAEDNCGKSEESCSQKDKKQIDALIDEDEEQIDALVAEFIRSLTEPKWTNLRETSVIINRESNRSITERDLDKAAKELNEELHQEFEELRIQRIREKNELVAAQVNLLKKAVQVAKIRTATFTRFKVKDNVEILAGTYIKFIELVGSPVGIDYVSIGNTKAEIQVPLWDFDDEAFPKEIANEYYRETAKQIRKFKIETVEDAYNILLCEVLVKLAKSTIDDVIKRENAVSNNELSAAPEVIATPGQMALLREHERERIEELLKEKKLEISITAETVARAKARLTKNIKAEVREEYDEDPEIIAAIKKFENIIDQDKEFVKYQNKRDLVKKVFLEVLIKGREGKELAKELGKDEDSITNAKQAALAILAKKYDIKIKED